MDETESARWHFAVGRFYEILLEYNIIFCKIIIDKQYYMIYSIDQEIIL